MLMEKKECYKIKGHLLPELKAHEPQVQNSKLKSFWIQLRSFYLPCKHQVLALIGSFSFSNKFRKLKSFCRLFIYLNNLDKIKKTFHR